MGNEDFEWFLNNYNKLYDKYGWSFLAIKGKKVIGVYDSYAEGVKATREKEPLGTFIVQECNGDMSAYTNFIASALVW